MEDDLLHAMSKLRHVCFIYVVTKVLRIFKAVLRSEHRDQKMRQVVAYKRLKIIKLSGGRGRLHEVVV